MHWCIDMAVAVQGTEAGGWFVFGSSRQTGAPLRNPHLEQILETLRHLLTVEDTAVAVQSLCKYYCLENQNGLFGEFDTISQWYGGGGLVPTGVAFSGGM